MRKKKSCTLFIIHIPIRFMPGQETSMDDLLAEFLTETNEGLEELDIDLVKLEKKPNDKGLLSKIFRIMHTIKGTCGFLGLPRLELVAHNGENVMTLFRDGTLEVTPEYVSLIFESLDRVRLILNGLEKTGEEPKGDDSELIKKLSAIADIGEENTPTKDEPDPFSAEENTETQKDHTKDNNKEVESMDTEQKTDSMDIPKSDAMAVSETEPDNTSIIESSVANQSLRVNVDVLENLMTLVSELVLTRNQLLQIQRVQGSTDFETPLQRLNHVVSDLQEGVMKTRMQPVGNAWAKLPRIVRDTSLELGKKIELIMSGQDTELDRQVLELIKDPLTHMVRNSADHGIELPAERLAAGKKETGKIKLSSYHEGGHIVIEISDDGKGLAINALKKKILENALASTEELAKMTPQQIQQFIFEPGFSTAAKVTSVSGRGVGMDVVRTNIEKIGGSVELKSVEGEGTTFLIKIPLTLAIVSALIVESAKERFAIPQLVVRELVMVSGDGDNRIEEIKGTPVFRLRDRLLPLVSLQELLNISIDTEEKSEEQKTEEENNNRQVQNRYIVVTQVGAYLFGIIVDRVFDTEEIVIKPVASILKNIEMFSGNTILGDGSVIMILDPSGIAKASGEIDIAETSEDLDTEEELAIGQEKTSLLLFSAGKGAPKAVPLELVARLEEIKMEDIEWADNQMVVQYRGKLMPLLPFDPGLQLEEEGHKPILVFADEDHAMGLIVDKIIDITEAHIDIQRQGRDGLVGSAIIDGKTTDIMEVSHFLRIVDSNWFEDATAFENGKKAGKNNHGQNRKVLLVEDSPFFRNMITPLLAVAGYEVTVVESAMRALELCEKGAGFDVIISDIEMPDMDGFEFAEKIKTDSQWKDVPLIALSAHATPEDKARGREAGFGDYVVKFDRETLLDVISQAITQQGGTS